MSGDSHRRQGDPEHDPLTKGPTYNPHIVLLQAPTHSSFLLNPKECTSPSTLLQHPHRLRAPNSLTQVYPYSQVQAAESMSISTKMLTSHILKLASNQTPDPYGLLQHRWPHVTKPMIAFEMNELEGHLRLHILRGDQVQVRRQQPYQLQWVQARPAGRVPTRQRPRDLRNIRPLFHRVFKIGRTSSRICRTYTLWRVGWQARRFPF